MDTKTVKVTRDFREHLFGATGADTDLSTFDMIDLYDNLAGELDELAAIAELLLCAKDFDDEAVGGVAQILKRIHKRTRAMLEIALEQGRRGARKGSR